MSPDDIRGLDDLHKLPFLQRPTCAMPIRPSGGRSGDMPIIKGVNVFPSQSEAVLMAQGCPANYQLVVDRVNNSDTLEVLVEMSPELFSDSLGSVTGHEKVLAAS